MENNNNDCGCSGNNNKTPIYGILPGDTTIISNPNGSLTAILASNWNYIGFDQNYNFAQADAASGGTPATITCICTKGGCSPYYVDSWFPIIGAIKGWACDIQDCSGSCAGSFTASVGGVPTNFSSGGYVDYSVTAAFMTQGQYLPGAFEAMFSSSHIITIINNFLNSIYNGQPVQNPIATGVNSFSAPDGYVFAFVNICGRATALVVPSNAVSAAMMTGIDGDCACNPKSSSGCDKKSKTGGISCKANGCNNCTLTLKNGVSPDAENNVFLPMTNFIAQCFTY